MGVKYLPRLFKLTTGDLFTTDFEYSSLKFGNHEIVKVKESKMDAIQFKNYFTQNDGSTDNAVEEVPSTDTTESVE